MPRAPTRARAPFGAALIIALTFAACGHRATEKECQEIVERVARLELERAKIGPELMARELKIAKESFQKDIGRRCVGRRITEEAMSCVRRAKSSQEIEDVCFR
jgi:hypothetical protein